MSVKYRCNKDRTSQIRCRLEVIGIAGAAPDLPFNIFRKGIDLSKKLCLFGIMLRRFVTDGLGNREGNDTLIIFAGLYSKATTFTFRARP